MREVLPELLKSFAKLINLPLAPSLTNVFQDFSHSDQLQVLGNVSNHIYTYTK